MYFLQLQALYLFSFLAFTGFHYGIPSDVSSRVIIGFLALGAGVCLVLFHFLAVRFSFRWNYLLLLELLFIIFLTVTDEFGWPDAVVLVTHLLSLALVAAKVRS